MQAEERHIRLVDDLLDRLAATGRPLPRDARILVLGAGHGTHDLGFVKHGLDVTNTDIQPETAALGEQRPVRLPGRVRHVVADTTRALPDHVPAGSMGPSSVSGRRSGTRTQTRTTPRCSVRRIPR
ncbi:hypothetical protein R6V09_18960 [Streptomyces sp. W16]|uniref:hypothetical protein n=1 Tax=Streptomyces sp. W16 TaxID=3076631 RepID=UPI00295A8CD9|nr:hypothetical protein [Streptomyces sp. W16]MDV9172182.1 hypothetical protein [Streptomyces sp. W16]